MEKRIINLNSSEKVMEMEYAFMYTVSDKISKDKGINNTLNVLKEILYYLKVKHWVSEDLEEYGIDKINNEIAPTLINQHNSLIDIFVNMLYDKIPRLN